MFLSNSAHYGLPEFNRPPWQRYGSALLSAAAAAATSLLLHKLTGSSAPWMIAFFPVILIAWYGGLGPSLLSALVGAGAVLYWFVQPSGLWHFATADSAMPLAAYLLASVAVAFLAEAYRHRLAEAAEQITTHQQYQEQLEFAVSHLRGASESLRDEARRESAQRKIVEDQLRISEERIRGAEAAAALRLFDWDLRRETIYVSGDVQAMFGVPADQWTGRDSLLAAVHPDDRPRIQQVVERATNTGGPAEFEFRVSFPDGSTHWISAKGNVFGQGGSLARLVGVFVDITTQKVTEQALIRHEKLAATGRMAATIAHEINNPLAALTNLLYIVRGDSTLSRAGAQYLAMAQEELKRVAYLANQALGFYKEKASPVPVQLPELLDEVLALYTRNIAANVRIEKHYGGSVEVSAIRGEIWQVFANLVSNALYAIRSGGTLAVDARAITGGMEVRVRDTGVGISAEHLDRIFQPFFTTKEETGTGLGLWIVKEIVEKHGGTIRVESRTSDPRGTCMTVFLPATTNAIIPAANSGAIEVRAN